MREFTIDHKNEGKKIFQFVKSVLPGLRNTEIFKLLRKKVIKVNQKKQVPEYILKNHDLVQIYLADAHFEKKGKQNKFYSISRDIDIIFEDANILVINKPFGLLVHPDQKEYKKNLYEMVRSYLYSQNEYDPKDTFSPTPCHRLDKNTTGVVIFAKKFKALQEVTEALRMREAMKIYQTLVSGKIDQKLLITSQIDTSSTKVTVKDLKIIKDIPEKKTFLSKNPDISATYVVPLQVSNNYSLVKIELWTGKKHQIRAHMCHTDYPLLGDHKYFNKISTRLSRELRIKFYFLHAYQLILKSYPVFEAPLPQPFVNQIKILF